MVVAILNNTNEIQQQHTDATKNKFSKMDGGDFIIVQMCNDGVL
jgi:hypothetical protein